MALFNAIFSPTEHTTILDIGAQIDPQNPYNFQLIDSHPWKEKITALNILPEHIDRIRQTYPQVNAVIGDACRLPWPDKSFDIAFSNAVIEHVGDYEKQLMMASEMMRISRRWFLTTPNRWYPFEFHLRLPFVTWLPGRAYIQAGKIVSYDHIARRYRWFVQEIEDLHLLSSSQLIRLFPGSLIIKQRVTFWPETLIVAGGQPCPDPESVSRAIQQASLIKG